MSQVFSLRAEWQDWLTLKNFKTN